MSAQPVSASGRARRPRSSAFGSFAVPATTRPMMPWAIAPSALDFRLARGDVLLREPLLTNPGATRIAIKAPVESLHAVLADLASKGITLERLYDY